MVVGTMSPAATENRIGIAISTLAVVDVNAVRPIRAF